MNRLILMDDRFTCHGDMVTIGLAEGEMLLHVATNGAGTSDLLLDAEMAVRIARALVDGAQRLDADDWRLKAAHSMLDDCEQAWEPERW